MIEDEIRKAAKILNSVRVDEVDRILRIDGAELNRMYVAMGLDPHWDDTKIYQLSEKDGICEVEE